MKLIETKSGYIAYAANAIETTCLGGVGVCDSCNSFALNGYLVPVLNRYLCPECFSSWNERAIQYPEDVKFEERTARYYEKMIPLEVDES